MGHRLTSATFGIKPILSAATLLPIKNLDLFTDLNNEWCAIQLEILGFR